MPGVATHFEILRLTIERLEASGDPKLAAIAQVITGNSAYAHLGAIGPSLADFLPSDPQPDPKKDPNPYALVWKMIFGLLGGDPESFPGSGLGLFYVLSRLRHILERMEQIANDEDCDQLEAIRDGNDPDLKLDDIQGTAEDFQTLVSALDPNTSNLVGDIADIIAKRLKPNVCTENVADPVPPPGTWQPRNFFHWKKTGRFVRALLAKAKETGDERLQAYAYGYIVSFVTNVCGSPFVNSSVGGPARTQWWRQRFVKNYVDAWVYGFYNMNPKPVMSGDTPTPDYDSWPSLCDANLQERIELAAVDPVGLMVNIKQAKPFPAGVVPDDFASRWFEAVQATYGAQLPVGMKGEALNGAYLMTWLVLWFQTSGAVIGCNLTEPMKPPDDCGNDPSELDPFKPGPGGGPSPPPAFDSDLEDTTAEVCGIILAILGGIFFLAGGAAAGAAAIGGAVALLDCSSVVEWGKLRCELYWYRKYVYNGLKGLQKLLAIAGFGYPNAATLKEDTQTLGLLGGIEFESGRNLVKSRGRDKLFPSKPWDGSLLTFNQRPAAANPGFEKPETIAYLAEAYPSLFVDDDTNNPIGSGDVKTGGPFPLRPQPGGMIPVQFGNAVANAVDLFKNVDKDLPDWNLDADRGMAYLTWQFKGFYDPDAVQIEPET